MEPRRQGPVATKDKIACFPALVPMANAYERDEYYIRDCYPTYYKLATRILKRGKYRGVTITGTPGIGKSMFMAYFFQQYSAEFPNATIRLKAYNRESVLKKAVTTVGRVRIKEVRYVDDTVETVFDAAAALQPAPSSESGRDIWLLDGPPKTIPDDVKWVSFTSPNEKWMAQLRKNTSTCCQIFMPVWTLEELCDAAVKLGRIKLLRAISLDVLRKLGATDDADESHAVMNDIDVKDATMGTNNDDMSVDSDGQENDENLLDDVADVILDDVVTNRTVIGFRFIIFGGVPRVCFEENDAVFIGVVKELQAAARTFTAGQVRTAITDDNAPVHVHRLLHYVPVEDNVSYPYMRATVQVASDAIERWYAKWGDALTSNAQKEIENIARYVPEMRTLQGYSVEARAKKLLCVTGCSIVATKLRGNGVDILEITLPPNCNPLQITAEVEVEEFNPDEPFVGVPASTYTTLQSIDAFAWMSKGEDLPKRVYLFQVTVSLKHPVKAFGLKKTLESLRHWEAVMKSPDTAAALVFVVPKCNEHVFRAQRIVAHPHLDDASPVNDIVGIGVSTAEKLKLLQIRTVGDLRKIKTQDDLRNIPVARARQNVRTVGDFFTVDSTTNAAKVAKTAEAALRLVCRSISKLKKHESKAGALPKGSEEEHVLQRIPEYVWAI